MGGFVQNVKGKHQTKEESRMKCEKCNIQMRLETIDDRDYLFCDKCEIGYLVDQKNNCEHDNVIFGVDGCILCDDCGMRLAYKLNQNFMEPKGFNQVKQKPYNPISQLR